MFRRVAFVACLLAGAVSIGAVVACEPVKLPHELPGPPGCGLRDPRTSGPSTMSVAQNTVLKNHGFPASAEPNEHGGRTWVFLRASGSVFGEQEAADLFVFDAQGLLVSQKTEVRRQVGK
jgi:hypothetical protein